MLQNQNEPLITSMSRKITLYSVANLIFSYLYAYWQKTGSQRRL